MKMKKMLLINKTKMENQTNKSKKLLLLEKILRFWAIIILKKYNPRIVGVTGSVGKTSTKEAIFEVMIKYARVRKNEKNYNNEIGLPLTIIGIESGGSSIMKWLLVFTKALWLVIFPVEYPEILVLELSADRPGDMAYLMSFIHCETVVITDISGSHLEFFKNLNGIAKEKWTLIEKALPGALAVVNIDNPTITKFRNQNKNENVEFLTFGFSDEADIQAKEVYFNYSNEEDSAKKEIKGLSFKLVYKGTMLPVRLNNVLARHSIYAALAAVAVGIKFKLNLVEIAASLANFSLPSGRATLISGLRDSFIIDDTYNSSPVSAAAALEIMREIKSTRKIAVMGDMLELGKDTEEGHRAVAKKFLEAKGDVFFAVGRRMQFAVEELKKHNFPSGNIFIFPDPTHAGKKLKEIMRAGDLILVKGSQGMRMEKVVEEVMSEPEAASYLLCRQDEAWRKKDWKEV